MQRPYRQILNKSAIINQQFANSSTLRPVLVRAQCILGHRHRVVWEAVLVEALAVRVAELLVAWTVAFDRALVNVRIVLLLGRHDRHDCLLECGGREALSWPVIIAADD